ncbi:MAG: UPF0179 family protein [Thermoproteota archaeon]
MNKYSYLSRGIKPGSVFTYLGETFECTQCSNRKVCHNTLNIGFSYRILKMTEGESVYCMLRGEKVFLYEVSPEPIVLLAPRGRVKEGAIMEIKLDDAFCKTDCERLGECPVLFNVLIADRKVRVLERLEDFNCSEKKLSLVRVEILD